MKTKEEILANQGHAYEYYHSTLVCPVKAAHEALDEYAKQQAIAFAVYLGGIMNGSVNAKIKIGGITGFDELYHQFIESQNK